MNQSNDPANAALNIGDDISANIPQPGPPPQANNARYTQAWTTVATMFNNLNGGAGITYAQVPNLSAYMGSIYPSFLEIAAGNVAQGICQILKSVQPKSYQLYFKLRAPICV